VLIIVDIAEEVSPMEMANMKPEEITHPPIMDQLAGMEYCIDSNPSWGKYSGV